MIAANTIYASFRGAVIFVAILNLAYFGVEFGVALAIGSVSLLADSIDFLEDASVNILIAFAAGWSPVWRARIGLALAAILLAPGIATLMAASHKLVTAVPPALMPLSLVAVAALFVNLLCAIILARYRAHRDSLTRAAFLSARNDVVTSVAIIATGLVTAYTHSIWPDLVVGLAIAAMNAGAAREVWQAARDEHRVSDRGLVNR
jgi:Co/Zn/Cd efflux system component